MNSLVIVTGAFAALIIIMGAFYLLALRKRLRRFFDRPCMGQKWRSEFPEANNPEIREFLQLFTDAFGLSSRKKLSFSPQDRLLDIYRTIYPKPSEPDGLEVETLISDCQSRYGVDISSICGENATLGDVFRATHPRSD